MYHLYLTEQECSQVPYQQVVKEHVCKNTTMIMCCFLQKKTQRRWQSKSLM